MSKFKIVFSTQFQETREVMEPECKAELDELVKILANGESLDEKHKNHELKKPFKGYNECNVNSNLVLIYRIKNEILELLLIFSGDSLA